MSKFLERNAIFVSLGLIILLLSSSVLTFRTGPQFVLTESRSNYSSVLLPEERSPIKDQSDNVHDNKISSKEIERTKEEKNNERVLNHAPVAHAGYDQMVKPGDKVILAGDKSHDIDGEELNFFWHQVLPRKNLFDLKGSHKVISSFVAPQVGESTIFEFELIVNDGNGGVGKDQIRVKVDDIAEEKIPVKMTIASEKISNGQAINTDSSRLDDRISAKGDRASISATNPCNLATLECNVNEGEAFSSGFTWGVVFISNGQLVPGLVAHVVKRSGPAELQFSSTDGNPAIVRFGWDNPAPPGTYKAEFALQILFCPAAHTKACNDFLNSRNQPVAFTINVNGKPTADDQEYSTEVNKSVEIILTASDPNDDDLSFEVLSQPTHGSLGGTAPSLTYTPEKDYSGDDSFTFKANDGKIDSDVATISISVEGKNRAPTAVGSWFSVTPTPRDKAFIGADIKLDGSDSFDLDSGDEVIKWHWEKELPSNTIVLDTLTDPDSEIASFTLPNYVPMEPSAFTFPKPLPIVFSLVVEDKHQAKSENNEIVSVQVECDPFSQNLAENTRNNLFLKLINHPFAFVLPQAVNNFQYFLSGKGDTKGLITGVSGNGIPKPLPISWLEKSPQFTTAQTMLATKLKNDITKLLSTMKVGETKTFPIPTPNPYITSVTAPGFPDNRSPAAIDFENSVGRGTLELIPHLTVKKNNAIVPDSVSGQITLKLIDIYDFNPVDSIRLPPVLGGQVFHPIDIHAIIKCLGARNFDQTTSYNKILTNMWVISFDRFLVPCPPGSCKIQ